MLISGVMFALVLAAQGAEAAVPVAAKPPAKAVEATKPKKVCVTEAQLGSHFKKRICATQEEWDRRRERDAAEMSKMADRAASN